MEWLHESVKKAIVGISGMPLDTDPTQSSLSIQRIRAMRDLHECTVWIAHDPEDWAELPHAPTPIE